MTDKPAEATRGQATSVRHVIEHALIDYGYTDDTARSLIDKLVAEARDE